jgi:hypothetical protein
MAYVCAASRSDIESLTMLIVMMKIRVWLQHFSTNVGLDDVHTPSSSTLSLSLGGMVHESCRVGEGQ